MSGQAGGGSRGRGSLLTRSLTSLRVVLPDSVPATGAAVPPAPVSSNPGLRDSAFSGESAI